MEITQFNNLIVFLINDIQEKPLFYVTMVLSILGAKWAAAKTNGLRGAGFLVWIASNGYIGYSFLLEHNIPMIITYILYEYYNIKGVYNNWIYKHDFNK